MRMGGETGWVYPSNFANISYPYRIIDMLLEPAPNIRLTKAFLANILELGTGMERGRARRGYWVLACSENIMPVGSNPGQLSRKVALL